MIEATTSTPGLHLRRLCASDEAAFTTYVTAVPGEEDRYAFYYKPGMSYFDYLHVLNTRAREIDFHDGHVPGTQFFGFAGGAIVGRLSLRHRLTPYLLNIGGHIGYVVLPAYRRRGYGTAMLREALPHVRKRGMERVLITCDESNAGSRRIIERCGGIYENSYTGPEVAEPKRRYWITLPR